MVNTGSELTFTLSANAGYKVKALTIGDATYSDVTDNTITKKVKIEKETAVSAVVEAEASSEPIPGVQITTDSNGTITATGTISLDQISNLAEKAVNGNVIDTKNLTIKSFKKENNNFTAYTISKTALKKAAKALSVLNIENADSTKQNITLDENANIKTISGDISLKDIMECSNEETTEIAKYIAYNLKEKTEPDFDSTNLKINTFYKQPKGNSKNIEWEYISTPITPKFLKETKLNVLNKAVLNFKDGDVNVPVAFKSTLTDYFDVNEFYKDVKTGKLNILKDTNITVKNDKPNSIQILLRDLQETITSGEFNITPYIKADKILELINNEKLKDALVIGDMYVTGNVKDLLPKLVGKNDGIKFLNVKEFTCPGINVTEYNGGNNNTEPLPMEQLLEFRKRTNIVRDDVLKKDTRSTRIQNLILENIDTTTVSEKNLQVLHFERNSTAGNIIFKKCNLSKLQYIGTSGTANVIFENTTLPQTMAQTTINGNLILKNVTFPKEEFINNYEFAELPYNLPAIENTLEIYGEIKDSILKDATPEQLESLVPQKNMPEKYKGSEEIYNRLKKIFRGEAQIINGNPNPNYHGSIQKQQSQLLALLQTQNKSRS